MALKLLNLCCDDLTQWNCDRNWSCSFVNCEWRLICSTNSITSQKAYRSDLVFGNRIASADLKVGEKGEHGRNNKLLKIIKYTFHSNTHFPNSRQKTLLQYQGCEANSFSRGDETSICGMSQEVVLEPSRRYIDLERYLCDLTQYLQPEIATNLGDSDAGIYIFLSVDEKYDNRCHRHGHD